MVSADGDATCAMPLHATCTLGNVGDATCVVPMQPLHSWRAEAGTILSRRSR